MSNNKDMKEGLHKLCDSFFQSEDEEKVAKELKDNLEKFFKVIKDKYGKDLHLNDGANEFLKEFSPWHQRVGIDLIDKFVNTIYDFDSNKDFSWLDILDTDKQWKKPGNEDIKKEIKDQRKHVNMRYQIPTHFHGDIDNAVIFHCMENPRGYLGDWEDNQIDEEFAGASLEEFYIKSAIKREEKSETIKDIIKERYQLTESEQKKDFKEKITEIIYNCKKSPLAIELDRMFKNFKDSDYKTYGFVKDSSDLKDYYYFKNYYKELLIGNDKNLELFIKQENKDKALERAEKICNVEIYPFSCKNPKLGDDGIGKKILLNSDLSRLGAYIVLRRIYKYLEEKNDKSQKPVFIFRKYDRAWEKLFKSIFKEAKKEKNNYGFQNQNTLKNLEKLFFYRQTRTEGGGITSGNVISIKNYKIYKDIFKTLKQTAFKEISDVLRRGDIDKNSSGKSGD
ncbi:hypothetical protein [Streptococcus koreensis]|uniref:Uncharacterized protein n=1 Tax=Streptococcus koreensis TaxID=2382163 RepID=A0ABM6Z7R7_9STRE|nr:hypothetical protein [Streptococcus koreensis]AYF93335.1 hypothetical protein D7D50_01185 [Streptococcus koreensis]